MFRELYDAVSVLWSWKWPIADGEIIAIDVEPVNNNRLRLAGAYKFSVGDDGPYTGEGFWTPAFSIGQQKSIRKARHTLHTRRRVRVRYRPDDPSVNTLVGGVRELLRG